MRYWGSMVKVGVGSFSKLIVLPSIFQGCLVCFVLCLPKAACDLELYLLNTCLII